MKVVLFSEPLKINSQNLLDIEIHLFSQFFIHSNNIRNTEIIHCLQTNLNNPLITNRKTRKLPTATRILQTATKMLPTATRILLTATITEKK